MNVLLAEAPYSYADFMVKGERYFPLGLGYIASYIRRVPGRSVRMFVGSLGQVRAEMKAHPPDVVGISSMTNTYPEAARLARIARECRAGCRIILGGQHVSSVGADVLADVPEADFLCLGEGEIVMDRFLGEIESGREDWTGIAGLVARTPAGVREGPPAVLIDDVETLPFPARDLVDLSQYKSHGQMRFGGRTASLITSRGCPWRCTYCSSNVTMGRKYRRRSAESVVAEFEELYRRHRVRTVVVWDDVFTLDAARVTAICEGLVRKRIRVSWYCQSRTDQVTPEMAKVMRRAGCRAISFGIESGSERTLERIRKNVDLGGVGRSIACCRDAGIRTQGTFILGFPWETPDEMEETVGFALKSGLDIAIFFGFMPFPGTDEWQFVPPEVRPTNVEGWRTFVCNNRLGRTWNRYLDDREMKAVLARAHWRFYMRPGQVLRIAASTRSAADLLGIVQNALSLVSSVAGMTM